MIPSFDTPTTRRNAFKIGGLTVTLAALAAACGEGRGGSEELGRVGNADPIEPLPAYEIDDAVLLRTASSLEITAITIYETVLGLEGAVPASAVPIIERLIDNHRVIADEMIALTETAGGEGWDAPNPWFMDRLVTPTVEAITSNVVGLVQEDTSMVQVKGEFLTISDVVTTSAGDITLVSDASDLSAGDEIEFFRIDGAVTEDVMTLAIGVENLAAAAHAELALAIGFTEARLAHVRAAALEARHGAKLAIELDGAAAYVSPSLVGEEVGATSLGQIRKFAVNSTFGQTAQVEIKAGPGDVNNVRESVVLQTPSDNSFVYNELEPS